MDAGAAAKKGGKKGGKGQAGGAPKKAAAPAKPQQQKKGQAQPQKAKAAAPAKPQQQQQKKGQAQPQKAKAAAPAPVKQEKKKAAPVKQEKVAEPATKKAKADEAEVAELSEAAQKELAAIEEQMAEITKEEMKAVAKITREFNGKRKPALEKRKTATSKIPKFWLQALANTPAAGLITDADAEIFAYLKDISCIEPTNEEADKDKSDDDFKIVFTFDKNPFFSNKQLWKEVKYTGDAEEVPPTITGSAVNWNKGKNPSEKKKTAAPAQEAAGKQKGKRALEAVDEDEDDEDDASFFEWFTSSELESADLGEWFRDKFCPNAVRYFFGDMSDSEDDSDLDDMDSEEEAAFARQFALGGGDDDEDDDEEDGDE